MSSSKQSVPKRLRARGERKSQGRPTLQWTIKRSAIDNASKIMQSASRLDRGDKERASERANAFLYLSTPNAKNAGQGENPAN